MRPRVYKELLRQTPSSTMPVVLLLTNKLCRISAWSGPQPHRHHSHPSSRLRPRLLLPIKLNQGGTTYTSTLSLVSRCWTNLGCPRHFPSTTCPKEACLPCLPAPSTHSTILALALVTTHCLWGMTASPALRIAASELDPLLPTAVSHFSTSTNSSSTHPSCSTTAAFRLTPMAVVTFHITRPRRPPPPVPAVVTFSSEAPFPTARSSTTRLRVLHTFNMTPMSP